MKPNQRLLVIGLDGATFDVLQPLIGEGRLPVLHDLIKNGVHGPLESTLPTNSYTAWASFMTGLNPGKHGIYDFRTPIKGDFPNKRVITSQNLKNETVFQIVSRHGLRSGVMNVPLTYPPSKINGSMISGILIPKVSEDICYPKDLYSEIVSRFGEYLADVSWNYYSHNIKKLLADTSAMTTQRKDIALYLMEKSDWELMTVVFVGPDRIQHALLKYLLSERGITPENRPVVEGIKDYFSLVDSCIGEITIKAGEETPVIILSDHGFQQAWKQVKLNKFLENLGMLSFKKTKASLHSIISKVDKGKIRKFRRSLMPKSGRYFKSLSASETIDWEKTKAYSALDIEQGISINLKGREAFGIIDPGEDFIHLRNEIKHHLLNLRDPESHSPVIKNVFFKEDILRGEFAGDGPDIIIEAHEGYYLGREKEANFAPLSWASGDHKREGVFIAAGRNIQRAKKISAARLIDVAPTMLYSLGLPIPDNMDGKVLSEIFSEENLQQKPILIEEAKKTANPEFKAHDVDAEGQRKIEEKLKGLGYFD